MTELVSLKLTDKELAEGDQYYRDNEFFAIRKARKRAKRLIKTAIKAGSTTIVRKRTGGPEDVTTRFLEGDVVCRLNAFVYKSGNQVVPTRKFTKYTVVETDPDQRWFRIDGDTKWHNANKFMLLEKAETELQKMVSKAMQTDESAETGDTDTS